VKVRMSPITTKDGHEVLDEGLVPGFGPQNEVEWAVACDPDIRRGWAFAVEGTGHPERLVGVHVATILRNIGPDDEAGPALRFVALVHDSMKWAVRRDVPWSPDNDHAALARRVAERHTSDPRLLQTTELHDEAYWIFRNSPSEPEALDALLARLPDTELYLRFVELDSTTEGKEPTFLVWLRNELGVRGLLPGGRPDTPHAGEGGQTIFLIEWATEPGRQAPFAAALGSALLGAPGADEWEQGEVLRSTDGARVVLLGRAAMRPDHAMLRGRSFAQRVVERVDQTGVHILEARLLEPVSP
jgi:hypothetical protein